MKEQAGYLSTTSSNRADSTTITNNDIPITQVSWLRNGMQIQSKYYSTGERCIAACFEDGTFTYYNPDGTPMLIEVPSDQYDQAVLAMRDRIQVGHVPGVTDPDEATLIVRQGHFTYGQVLNIAMSGKIDSIRYADEQGGIVSTSTFGVTTIVSFAISIWNGDDIDLALKNAVVSGLNVGGQSLITSVFAGQLSKLGLNNLLIGSSEAVVKVVGSKTSRFLMNTLQRSRNAYGATIFKRLGRLFRSNVFTNTLAMAVLSTGDILKIFQSKISGKQFTKNLARIAASLAGGTVGWSLGAGLGTTVGTGIATSGSAFGSVIANGISIIFGLLGAFGGASAAGGLTYAALGTFIEDDANVMVRILEEEFTVLAHDYLLNERETEQIVANLSESLTSKDLQEMFASEDRREHAQGLMMPHVERELFRRVMIDMLDFETFQHGLEMVLEDMAEEDQELVRG